MKDVWFQLGEPSFILLSLALVLQHASHLPSYIRFVDYLVVTTLHSLLVNSVTKLLAMLQEQVRQTPSRAIIESWNKNSVAITDPIHQEMDRKVGLYFSASTLLHTVTLRRCSTDQYSVLFWLPCVSPNVQPLFTTEMILETNTLTYKPSEENFQVGFPNCYEQLLSTVCVVCLLIP